MKRQINASTFDYSIQNISRFPSIKEFKVYYYYCKKYVLQYYKHIRVIEKKERERKREREKERERERHRDRQTDRQTERDTDRQTDRERKRERQANKFRNVIFIC